MASASNHFWVRSNASGFEPVLVGPFTTLVGPGSGLRLTKFRAGYDLCIFLGAIET